MEEKQINEKESLELISQMIQASRKRLSLGDGNELLHFGYFTLCLSMVITAIILYTRSGVWSWCWMLMFVFWAFESFKNKKNPPHMVSYTDRLISGVWLVLGFMFAVSAIALTVLSFILGYSSMSLMMPLSLIYCVIGVSITGVVINEKSLMFLPCLALIPAFYMFTEIVGDQYLNVLDTLLFGISFIFMMIIPGHILNYKATKQCLKN